MIIEKKENNLIDIPAGALEENETIEECIIREEKEETGLEILSLEVIGIGSNPKNESVQYPNGDRIQYFTVEFYSNHWQGEININDNDEIQSCRFDNPNLINQLPRNEQSAFESLAFFRKHQKIMMK